MRHGKAIVVIVQRTPIEESNARVLRASKYRVSALYIYISIYIDSDSFQRVCAFHNTACQSSRTKPRLSVGQLRSMECSGSVRIHKQKTCGVFVVDFKCREFQGFKLDKGGNMLYASHESAGRCIVLFSGRVSSHKMRHDWVIIVQVLTTQKCKPKQCEITFHLLRSICGVYLPTTFQECAEFFHVRESYKTYYERVIQLFQKCDYISVTGTPGLLRRWLKGNTESVLRRHGEMDML